jgi:hypothetical protein
MAKTMFGLPVLLLLGLSTASGGQCPVIKNCPQGSVQVCDVSENDPLLWNADPFTRSPTLDLPDLPEAAADFTVKVLDSCSVSPPSISFVLFFDLDGDDLMETAVTSASLPPPGVVLANSAFSPGFTQGDTMWFDLRPVPDSLKYSFILQTHTSGDTLIGQLRWATLANPGQFIAPRLPEGRHRLQWKVVSNGVTRTCEHVFRVKDCQEPNVQCLDAAMVSIGADGTGTLTADQVLQAMQDNITPLPLLETALRRQGAGTGFPLDSAGLPVPAIVFGCADAGPQAVELWVLDRSGNAASCTVTVSVLAGSPACDPPPLPPPVLCARPFWNDTLVVQEVDFRLVWATPAMMLDTLHLALTPAGCADLDTLPQASTFSLIPWKDDNPLNGVTTFDLVLISRHILGLQPFAQPWQIVAADVNQSASVTTFDIVEMRKLILGIYDRFPNNSSWRFFTDDCEFPPNPFTGWCPTSYTFPVMPLEQYPSDLPYNALKVGDVNGTASLGADDVAPEAGARRAVTVELPDLDLGAGQTIEVALRATGPDQWLGYQLALECDPALLEMEAVLAGDWPDWNAQPNHRAGPGDVTASWMQPAGQRVEAGDALLRLRLRARTDLSLRDVVRWSDRLRPEAYDADGQTAALQLVFSREDRPAGGLRVGGPQPNPTRGGISFPLQLTEPAPVLLEVFDGAGQRVFRQDGFLNAGPQRLEVPSLALPHPGIFGWRLQAGTSERNGKLVKLP